MTIRNVQVHSVVAATVTFDDETGEVTNVRVDGLTEGAELYSDAETGAYDLDREAWVFGDDAPFAAREAGWDAIGDLIGRGFASYLDGAS